MSEGRQIWFKWDGVRLRAVHPRGLTLRLAMVGLNLVTFFATMFVSRRYPEFSPWVLWAPLAVMLGGFALMWRHVR
jgi:hypothetical protein